jgi:hypothetical protein
MNQMLTTDLLALRSRDRRHRDQEQIRNYVKGIYQTVLEEARHGTQTYVTFWLVDAFNKHRYLLNTIEFFYSWHSKSIRRSENPLKNYFMKRPIPEELYKAIFHQIRDLFPDCEITVEHDPIPLLVIRWATSHGLEQCPQQTPLHE